MKESEGTEITFPLYPYLLQTQQALPNCKPISVGGLGDVRYTPRVFRPQTLIRSSNCQLDNLIFNNRKSDRIAFQHRKKKKILKTYRNNS